MKHSDTLKELAGAMAKAQAEMPSVTMNAVNPFLKNKFADLGAVISTIRPVLASHGLSYSQLPYSEDGRVGVTTIIMHESGEWIEETAALELSDEKGKSAAQVAGSIITYLRRYSLSAAFGLYADEDSDGSHTEQKKVQPAKVTAPSAPETDGTKMVVVMAGDTIKHMVSAGIFDAEQAAAIVLARLFPKQKKAPLAKIEEVAQLYRDNKDACKDTDKAIEATLNGEVL